MHALQAKRSENQQRLLRARREGRLLDAYAEVHGRLHGPVDAVPLIPHMLAAFIARDRASRPRSPAARAGCRGALNVASKKRMEQARGLG
ncbi:DUF2274 domain-containing protein [Variovorax paradoxus]|nr:DUF2274 domain-containing protein [Variovorax paradoxus]MBT2303896.1 DUF2274 domain-containing protein [Variovorax paradoxus]